MVYYRISREVTERDATWSFSRDLTIRPDRTDIWCASLHTCVFGSFWFFATGFPGKGEKGKVPRRSQEKHLFTEMLFEEEAAHSIKIYLLILWDRPNFCYVAMHPHVCDLFLLFATGFSGKGGKEESMGRTNKTIDGRDTTGSENSAGNALLSHFGFRITEGKGNKGLECPVKKAGSPCKTVHPGIPIKKAWNKVISESMVVFPCKDYVKEGTTKIAESVLCEDFEGTKKEISDIDQEVLLLKVWEKKIIRERTME